MIDPIVVWDRRGTEGLCRWIKGLGAVEKIYAVGTLFKEDLSVCKEGRGVAIARGG